MVPVIVNILSCPVIVGRTLYVGHIDPTMFAKSGSIVTTSGDVVAFASSSNTNGAQN